MLPRTSIVFSVLWLVAGAASLSGETLQLTPSDLSLRPRNFGHEVAINSTHALVSSSQLGGSVAMFDLQTGDEVFEFASNEDRDLFGNALVLTEKYAAIAASHSDELVKKGGKVYVYDASTHNLLHEIVPEDPTPNGIFGASIDVFEDTLVVGSPWLSRSAYAFDLTTGQQLHKLLPDQPISVDERFGRSVAVSGNRIVVGARDERDNEDGSAYMFDLTSGQQLDRLTPADGRERPRFARPRFGEVVAIDGDLAVVGEFPNQARNNGRGAVDVFDLASSGEALGQLLPDNNLRQYFGAPLDLSGETVIVGAHHDSDFADNSGSAYVFDARSGNLRTKFVGQEVGEELGIAVDILDDRAIVGAWGATVGDVDFAGRAYVFTVPEPSAGAVVLTLLVVALIGRHWGERPKGSH